MRKSAFPRLRRKGRALYFDTQEKPRRWIALGTDPVVAMTRYRALMTSQGSAGTVERMVAKYLTHLEAGGLSVNQKAPRPHTLAMYRAWAAHVCRVFGEQAPGDITPRDIVLYLAQCKRTSAHDEISILSAAYQHGMLHGRIEANPCATVKVYRAPSRRERLLSDAELAAIRAHASPLLQVALDLLYLTGMRPGDAIAVRWDAFADGGHVRTAKTGARIRYTLTDDLRAVLEAARALAGRVTPMTVLSHRGRPLSKGRLGDLWRAACKAAGVEDAQLRDVRAKSASDADSEQAGSATALLGHSDARTTRLYLRGREVREVKPLRKKS